MEGEQLITTMETLGKLKCQIAVIDDLHALEWKALIFGHNSMNTVVHPRD